MPDADLETQGEEPEVEVVVHQPAEKPVREMNPVAFFGPGDERHQVESDYRPAVHAFHDDDDDYNLEDGQGNFAHPSSPALIHPSTPPGERAKIFAEHGEVDPLFKTSGVDAASTDTTEETGSPETDEAKQASPFPI